MSMNARQSLGFPREAESQFAFLVNECGYALTFRSDTGVRYESTKVWIDVFHGAYDYEVGINFGRRAKEESFSFLLFCRLMKVQSVTSIELISDDKMRVKELLSILSKALAKEGAKIVSGDDATFEKMKSVRWWHFRPEALGN
jgi:hypothetical protein